MSADLQSHYHLQLSHTRLIPTPHSSKLPRLLRAPLKLHNRSLLHIVRLRKARLPEKVRPHTAPIPLQRRRRRLVCRPHAVQMQACAFGAVRGVSGSALLAFLAVVDGEQDEVADTEVLVLDFRPDGADGAGSFVAEDGWVFADLDFPLLEDEVLFVVSDYCWCIACVQNRPYGRCQRTSYPPRPHRLASRPGRHSPGQSPPLACGRHKRSFRCLSVSRPP